MHEAGLARAAVASLSDAAAGQRVRAVVLVVGAGVDIDSAASAWQLATAGTCLEEASVTWRRGRDSLRCFTCGQRYDGEALDRCPSCDGTGLVVARAAEIAVEGWELWSS